MKKQYGEVKCTKGGTINGHTFKVGEIYPILGWNNGHHLVYENEKGDVEELLLLDIDFHLEDGNDTVRFDGCNTHKKNIILILKFLGILFIIFYIICHFLPQKTLSLDDCLEFGICAEGLELKEDGKPYIMTKEYCAQNHFLWDEKSKSCNVRKTTY
jgi:hypothetical protein